MKKKKKKRNWGVRKGGIKGEDWQELIIRDLQSHPHLWGPGWAENAGLKGVSWEEQRSYAGSKWRGGGGRQPWQWCTLVLIHILSALSPHRGKSRPVTSASEHTAKFPSPDSSPARLLLFVRLNGGRWDWGAPGDWESVEPSVFDSGQVGEGEGGKSQAGPGACIWVSSHSFSGTLLSLRPQRQQVPGGSLLLKPSICSTLSGEVNPFTRVVCAKTCWLWVGDLQYKHSTEAIHTPK